MLIRQYDTTKDACILINVERVATWFVRCFDEGCVIQIGMENSRESRSLFRVAPHMPYPDAEAALMELGEIVTSGRSGVVSWDATNGWLVA